MTEELRAKMEELRALAPRLNETSNSAARIIRSVEVFLNGLGIGVSGSSFFDEDPADSEDDGVVRKISSYLAYGRIHGDFSIHILRQTCREEMDTYGIMQDVPESEERVPWSGSTREVKLKSFARLPSLLDDILRNARSQAEEAGKTAATVEEMLSTLTHIVVEEEPEEDQPTKAPVARRRR